MVDEEYIKELETMKNNVWLSLIDAQNSPDKSQDQKNIIKLITEQLIDIQEEIDKAKKANYTPKLNNEKNIIPLLLIGIGFLFIIYKGKK